MAFVFGVSILFDAYDDECVAVEDALVVLEVEKRNKEVALCQRGMVLSFYEETGEAHELYLVAGLRALGMDGFLTGGHLIIV